MHTYKTYFIIYMTLFEKIMFFNNYLKKIMLYYNWFL